MHLAVIIRAEHKERLPSAADLRRAGFAVSSALEPDRDADRGEEDGPRPGRAGPGRAGPEQAGPTGPCSTERQGP
jgi:hypothetical protein